MRNRFRSALIAALTLIASQLAVAPVGAVVDQKVVIIVGPTGAQTANYRSRGDDIATAAEATGATVVKVYSPNATWANVKAAVNGANVVVYLGHGNGFPNPYNTTEPRDRDNGWGLNRTTSGGDTDNWSTTMVYCGEKALLGTLTSSDGAAQRTYCAGGPITPAPNWVMVYSNACYAPGASEGSDVPATEAVAMQRVRNYSYPALLLGAGAYFATDMGSQPLVEDILENPDMAFGELAERARGYDLYRQRHFAHPDLPGKRIWIQNTGSPTSGNYFFAYAGTPDLTPSGNTVAYTEPSPPAVPTPAVVGRYPVAGASGVATSATPAVRFDRVVTGVGSGSFVLRRADGTAVAATVWNTGDSQQFALIPASALAPGSSYTLSVTASIYGVEGGALTPESWTFTTAGTPPPPPPSGSTTFSPAVQVLFKVGTHTGYQFNSSGALTASKSYTLTKDSGAATSARATIANQSGSWLYITNGVWAGYWLRQSSVLYVAATPISAPGGANATFSPAVQLLFKKGTHTGYQFSASGAMTAQKSYTLTKDSGAATSARSTLTNQAGTWFYVTNGVWAGYWLRSSDVLGLAAG